MSNHTKKRIDAIVEMYKRGHRNTLERERSPSETVSSSSSIDRDPTIVHNKVSRKSFVDPDSDSDITFDDTLARAKQNQVVSDPDSDSDITFDDTLARAKQDEVVSDPDSDSDVIFDALTRAKQNEVVSDPDSDSDVLDSDDDSDDDSGSNSEVSFGKIQTHAHNPLFNPMRPTYLGDFENFSSSLVVSSNVHATFTNSDPTSGWTIVSATIDPTRIIIALNDSEMYSTKFEPENPYCATSDRIDTDELIVYSSVADTAYRISKEIKSESQQHSICIDAVVAVGPSFNARTTIKSHSMCAMDGFIRQGFWRSIGWKRLAAASMERRDDSKQYFVSRCRMDDLDTDFSALYHNMLWVHSIGGSMVDLIAAQRYMAGLTNLCSATPDRFISLRPLWPIQCMFLAVHPEFEKIAPINTDIVLLLMVFLTGMARIKHARNEVWPTTITESIVLDVLASLGVMTRGFADLINYKVTDDNDAHQDALDPSFVLKTLDYRAQPITIDMGNSPPMLIYKDRCTDKFRSDLLDSLSARPTDVRNGTYTACVPVRAKYVHSLVVAVLAGFYTVDSSDIRIDPLEPPKARVLEGYRRTIEPSLDLYAGAAHELRLLGAAAPSRCHIEIHTINMRDKNMDVYPIYANVLVQFPETTTPDEMLRLADLMFMWLHTGIPGAYEGIIKLSDFFYTIINNRSIIPCRKSFCNRVLESIAVHAIRRSDATLAIL